MVKGRKKFFLIYLLTFSGGVFSQEYVETFLFNEEQGDVVSSNLDETLNFLTLKRKIHQENKEFKDFSICFRLNFLSHIDTSISIPLWLQTNKYVDLINEATGFRQTMSSTFWAEFGMQYAIFMRTFPADMGQVLSANGIYALWPEFDGGDLNANQWHSICLGIDVKKKNIYLVHNGQTFVNLTQPEIWAEKNKGFDTSMLEPFSTKDVWDRTEKLNPWSLAWSGAMLAMTGLPISGYFTDLQIFGQTLSAPEMHDITSCKSFKEGDIYSWDVNDWEVYDKELQRNKTTAVHYRKVEIPRSSLCKTGEKYTYFPDDYSFKDGIHLCKKFGGKLVDVSTSEKVNAVVTFLGKDIKENPKYEGIVPYTMSTYTDVKEFNVWRHYETGELPDDPLIWNIGEPNGGMMENCAMLLVQTSAEDESKYIASFNDYICGNGMPLACEDIGELLLKLRGICKNSVIDTSYTMIEGSTNKKRFFAGNTGWRIYWDDSGELWRLSSPKEEYMYGLHTQFETYPLGKNYWSIVNDSRCVYSDPEKVLLNLSPCNATSFTCDDGTCVPMTGR